MLQRPTSHTTAPHSQTFEQIYHKHIDALYHYGIKFKANQQLVEDCIQDLFADLWQRPESLSRVKNMRPYLLGALRRKLLKRIYAEKEAPYPEEELNTFFEVRFADNSEVQKLFDQEHLLIIHSAFCKLTEKQKEVIYLRFYNQLSFEEIAEVMSVQTRTIYKLSHRALTVLKEELGPYSSALQVFILLLNQ
ncbi:RNA polymerase sigma factor [Fulvivirga ligni]|uniref:RNA polymerase sigma factor n=1 Tax=Fulvivirga ligni TaxID=2904246 RepID=UPI001F1FC5A8|nr:sigma-70 family RNA polymerase sigma factor [Fulvivirga ligni]UII20937.1 sigma-70 family RNA polymerase sigma factor [Fulvivirga ligni]